MATDTLPSAFTPDLDAPAVSAAAPKPSFWSRAYDAMVQAQMRRAAREVALYQGKLTRFRGND